MYKNQRPLMTGIGLTECKIGEKRQIMLKNVARLVFHQIFKMIAYHLPKSFVKDCKLACGCIFTIIENEASFGCVTWYYRIVMDKLA